jgi:galactokinase
MPADGRRRAGAAGRGVHRADRAAARRDLVGEHTDYNDGFVLPLAIPARTSAAAAPRQDGRLSVRSLQRPGELTDVAVADLRPGHPGGAAAYVARVVWAFRAAGHQVGGFDIVIDGAVPVGSGLSSSAALECATALAVSAQRDRDAAR